MRCLVIALGFHIAILFALAAVKIAVVVHKEIPGIIPDFLSVVSKTETDPHTPIGDTTHDGPKLGEGGGVGGKGPGGVKTAAGNLPTDYPPTIKSTQAAGNDTVPDIIGPNAGDVGKDFVRPQGSPGSIGGPSQGLGNANIGTSGIYGPGGPFGPRIGPKPTIPGNTLPADRAVLAALRWLQTHQKADGSWESSRPAAIAGLATLAFLGHGHTPDDPDFGETVSKALQFLVRSINKDNYVGPAMYDHAIVTYALAEGFGMSHQSIALKEPLQRCINTLLKAQQVPKAKPHHTGGWRYNVNSTDSDTSVTGWCVQALEAAKLAGMDVPDSAFIGASKYLAAVTDSNGITGYANPGGNVGAMTAVGVLAQAFMGRGGDLRMKKSLDKLKTLKFDWDTAGNFTVYSFYYVTQAMFQGGGAYWEYWNGQFRDALISKQDQDGHWPLPPKSNEKYGDAYQTALGCLMLEVYYRYLPSYKAIEKGQYEKGISAMSLPLPKLPDQKKK